jgi:SagB-type dehydrogenase family enzyme
MPDSESDAAELFHENSKVSAFEMGFESPELPPLKPGVVLARVPLPKVSPALGFELEMSIERRVTCREYDPRIPLSLELLSRLLSFSFGYTRSMPGPSGPGQMFHHASPSAGATYPLEIYPIVLRVAGVPPGVYHYSLYSHSLELIRPGLFNQGLPAWTLYQPYLAETSVVFVMAGFSERIRPRYGQRGYRYMLIEAGHVGQNLYLLSTAYGLGAMADGGFVDKTINELLGLNEITENALYIVAVGIPRASAGGTYF